MPWLPRNRRDVIGLARVAIATALMSVLAVACAAPPAAKPGANSTSFKGQTLTVSATAGAITDGLKAGIGKVFEERTGASIRWVAADPSAAVSQLIAAKGSTPPMDVIANMDSVSEARAIAADVLQQVNYDNVPNAKDLPDSARRAPGYGPGAWYYILGNCYNTEKLQAAGIEEPTGVQAWFDPRLANRVSLPDSTQAAWEIGMPALSLGMGLSATDPQPFVDRIKQIRGLHLPASQSDTDTLLTSGDAWMALNSDGRCNGLLARGVPLKFGSLGLRIDGKAYDYIAVTTGPEIAKGTQNARLAEEFINLMLTPEGVLPLTTQLVYTPTVPAAAQQQAANEKVAPYLMPKTAALYTHDYQQYFPLKQAWVDAWNRAFKN